MDIRRYIYNSLKNIQIDESDLSSETNFILQNLFNISNPYFDIEIDDKDIQKLREVLKKRETGMPLQYILSVANFMGEKFFVNESVLIPRPETEILVKKTEEIASIFNNPNILDIGTGSGCIAIMLSKILKQKIYSCDISSKAIEVAQKNALSLNADVDFILSNIFCNINKKFDIIVSNPPYIPPQVKPSIQKEVLFEPDLALYTNDNNGIEFYEKIIRQSEKYLNQNGYILFELGINQAELVKKIFMNYNFSKMEVIKDLDNIDRVILARKDYE